MKSANSFFYDAADTSIEESLRLEPKTISCSDRFFIGEQSMLSKKWQSLDKVIGWQGGCTNSKRETTKRHLDGAKKEI